MERNMNTTPNKQAKTDNLEVFGKTSRWIILIACVFIVTGYILMGGPGSTEQHFEVDVFSARRIIVAPMLCLAGYLLIIAGILKRG